MKSIFVLLLLPVLALTACRSSERQARVDEGAPAESANALVLDVRTPEEFASGHINGAINLPVDEIEKRIAAVAPDKAAPVMVHCRSGGRSARAKAALESMGYTRVTDLGSLANARQTLEKN